MPAPYYNPYNGYNPNGYYPQMPPQYNSPQPNYQPYTPPAQTNPPSLSGRMVNSISEVTPQEVPMNGEASIFPQRDGSVIFAKMWNQDGTIKTVRYVPEPEGALGNATADSKEDPIALILGRLDGIEKKIEGLTNRKKTKYDNYRGDRPRRNDNYSARDEYEDSEVIDNA